MKNEFVFTESQLSALLFDICEENTGFRDAGKRFGLTTHAIARQEKIAERKDYEAIKDDCLRLITLNSPSLACWGQIADEVNSFGLSLMSPERPQSIGSYLYLKRKLIGGCNGTIIGSRIYIEVLWVSSESRRNGYGERLLMATIERAHEQNCQDVFLETQNTGAGVLYSQLGFTCLASVPAYFKDQPKLIFFKRLKAKKSDGIRQVKIIP